MTEAKTHTEDSAVRISEKTPETAIFLGSGCSVRLGVPPLAGFMDAVFDQLGKAGNGTDDGTHLCNLQDFIREIKGSAAYVRTDFLNIEELYGLAEMFSDLSSDKNNPGQKALGALKKAIYKITIKAGVELLDENRDFLKIAKQLDLVKRDSQTGTPVHADFGTRHTNLLAYLCLASFKDGTDENGTYPLVAQFNWDLAYDRALFIFLKAQQSNANTFADKMKKMIPWYDFGPFPKDKKNEFSFTEQPLVLRPHGAVNWLAINKCEDTDPLEEFKELSFIKLQVGDPNSKNGERLLHVPVNSIIDSTLAGEGNNMFDPYWAQYMRIVPPTWQKDVKQFQGQWNLLKRYLETVRRIVFIGYSLPKSDLYFRHFMATALANNNFAPKVYVWNPKIHEDSPERESYTDLFAPLAREDRLFGIPGRFGEPAMFDLNRAFYLAKPISP